MLVIGRRKGQKIRINNDIVLHVVSVRGSQVSIGIDAPAHVQILRPEAHKKTAPEQRDSAKDEVSNNVNKI